MCVVIILYVGISSETSEIFWYPVGQGVNAIEALIFSGFFFPIA